MLRRELIGKIASASAAVACAPALAISKADAPPTVFDAFANKGGYMVDVLNSSEHSLDNRLYAEKCTRLYQTAVELGLVTEIPQAVVAAVHELGFETYLRSHIINPHGVHDFEQGTITYTMQSTITESMDKACKKARLLVAFRPRCAVLIYSNYCTLQDCLPGAYQVLINTLAALTGKPVPGVYSAYLASLST